MGFPSEVNSQAIRQVVRFVTGEDKDTGRIALAAYDVEGYILGKVFPNAAYMTDGLVADCPEQPLAQDDPFFTQFKAELEATGLDWTAILAQLKEALGPIVLNLIMKYLLK